MAAAETETDPQSDVIAFLARPDTHGGAAVERITTHGAHIFLAGGRAYKLKRAVKLPFMDFSTNEKRREMLERELRINRTASAGDLYLEVLPVARGADGRLALGGAGEAVDWVLAMRRFDQNDLLDDMARRGVLDADLMEPLTDTIAEMHRRAPVRRRAEDAIFARTALDNTRALRDLPADPALVARLGAALEAACAAQGPHLAARAAGGFVRECHGDLHLRNIVRIGGRPTPFDALEFDSDLATGDVYYDLAFLLMDLEHRGLRPLASRVLNRYVSCTGDIAGLAALSLFLAARAAVRAKVAAITAVSADPNAAPAKRAEAEAYLRLGCGYLPPAPPLLVAIGGLSGTGKSVLAGRLADRIRPSPGALWLRSDVARKRMHGVAATARLPADAYTPEATARIYGALARDARAALRAGCSVILDAVFARPEERAAVEAAARDAGVGFMGLWLEAGLETRRARVAGRVNDASDADEKVVARQESYDVGAVTWRAIDAGAGKDETLRRAISLFDAAAIFS